MVMTIPALTVAGMLWVARKVYNRLPPTVRSNRSPSIIPFTENFGFVNFSLSMALAL